MSWELVEELTPEVKAICWDNCHKIYLLLDDEQVEMFRSYDYDPIITDNEATPEEMLAILKEWFYNSCSLRFIQAVKTESNDSNNGFRNLISQGEIEREEANA